LDVRWTVVVYDQSTSESQLPLAHSESFLAVLLDKLATNFNSVFLLKGGITEFKMAYPMLCKTSEVKLSVSGGDGLDPRHHHHHSSLSQPCLPVTNIGPTRILPFLFLGSERDSLCKEIMVQNGISYVINVSTSSPKPPFIPDEHFLRIPVNDNYNDKLMPYFDEAFQFLDKVREASGYVLIHCLAGISRSPTLAIAYVMRVFGIGTDEAYRYVKDKRPTISPNFNFLGQLIEYEQRLDVTRSQPNGCHQERWNAACVRHVGPDPRFDDENSIVAGEGVVKKPRVSGLDCRATKLNFELVSRPMPAVNSPTTALSLLNFNHLSPLREFPSPPTDDRLLTAVGVSTSVGDGPSPGVVIRLGSKHCQGGTLKRPLSVPSCDEMSSPLVCSGGGELLVGTSGFAAKRPLSRPRSITLATTIQPAVVSPRVLSASDEASVSVEVSTAAKDRELASHQTADGQTEIDSFWLRTAPDRSAPQFQGRSTSKMPLPSLSQPDAVSTATAGGAAFCFLSSANKSHSLEDMLTSSDLPSSSLVPSPSSNRSTVSRTLQLTCCSKDDRIGPVYRCHEASSAEAPHHPGSGLSSAGSHSSLLDSPEVIRVS
jgi:dual specificity MAP kinase phosphatase